MIVQVCVGSSCHLKGSPEVVDLLRKHLAADKLEDDVILMGAFCIGKCNREGVTVQLDDEIVCGVNRENFLDFYRQHIREPLLNGGASNG
ncbi:MAG: NAD(P)H-dependent oxidoreductase subunit E [Oscillospiraceae bacterium]|nr:NAD(P)H-dependent oxidoreductase subunit E [Oscillospiraceae bacterium]